MISQKIQTYKIKICITHLCKNNTIKPHKQFENIVSGEFKLNQWANESTDTEYIACENQDKKFKYDQLALNQFHNHELESSSENACYHKQDQKIPNWFKRNDLWKSKYQSKGILILIIYFIFLDLHLDQNLLKRNFSKQRKESKIINADLHLSSPKEQQRLTFSEIDPKLSLDTPDVISKINLNQKCKSRKKRKSGRNTIELSDVIFLY